MTVPGAWRLTAPARFPHLGYDNAGRTKTLTSGSALNLTYGYDPVGNVESITEPLQATQQFGYDALNRLTSAAGAWGQRSWQYHASGDRLMESGAGSIFYSYHASTRRLASTSGARTEVFAYNPSGELTGDGLGTYQYNASGLVTQFTAPNVSAAYAYDPSGLRIARTVNNVITYTVRSAAGSVLSEYRDACGGPVWTRDVIYAGDRLLGSIRAATTQASVGVSQSAVSVSEGTATLTATLTLTTVGGTALPCPVTVSYAAIAGSATAGVDYRLPAGSVTFTTGSPTGATRTVTIEILADTLDETNETLAFTLADVTGGIAGTPHRTDITITDDDPTPSLSISDVTLYEGNAGTTHAVFTISLSAPSGQPVSVAYASSNSAATAGSDYQAVSGTGSIAPGLSTTIVSVPIYGDGAFEPNESFLVTLSAPSLASLLDAQGVGTILNDDASGNTWGDFYVPRDGSADAALFNPASRLWTFKDSNTGNVATFGPFGDTATYHDKLVPADYTGDGITDCATYRPSTGIWTLAPSCLTTGHYSYAWGGTDLPYDVPVPADYDGDGKADIAVYRLTNATWYIAKSTGGSTIVAWGGTDLPSDVPVPADYDGDGKADIAVYRPANDTWYVDKSTGGSMIVGWGLAGGLPIPADYDGDGKADLAFMDPATAGWYLVPSTTGIGQVTWFGVSGQTPVPAEYDGDGKVDIAFYHPPDRSLWILRSTTGTALGISLWDMSEAGALPVLRKPQ